MAPMITSRLRIAWRTGEDEVCGSPLVVCCWTHPPVESRISLPTARVAAATAGESAEGAGRAAPVDWGGGGGDRMATGG